MHVQFINREPSEKEYFEEYAKYTTLTNLWFLIIFVLTTYVSLCLALQMGAYEFRDSVELYMSTVEMRMSRNLLNISRELERSSFFNDSNRRSMSCTNCTRKDTIIRMEVFKGVGYCVGAFVGGILSDIYGRKTVSSYGSFIWNFFAWALIGLKHSVAVEIFQAFLATCCAAVEVATLVTFAEISSVKFRLLAIYTVFGSVIGDFLMNYITKSLMIWWQLLIFIACVNSMVIFTCWYLPESPKWLMNKNKKKIAYEQLNEISGYTYNIPESSVEDDNILTNRQVFVKMFQYLYRRKLKYFFLISLSMLTSSINYSSAKIQAIQYYGDNRDLREMLNGMDATGFLFLYPIFIFLGERLSLFLIATALVIEAMVILLRDFYIRDESLYHYSIFDIMIGLTGICLNWLYAMIMFPTFLRATVIGFLFFIWGLSMTITAISYEHSRSFVYYLIRFFIGMLGTSVLAIPRLSAKEFPNLKLK